MSDERELMLELVGVSHSYHARKASFDHGVHRVLDDVSLKVYEGETLGIIGRNGCGKTTILRLMSGILAPVKGDIRRRKNAKVSLLSLGLGFKPNLSGRDNAMLSAMLQGASKRDAASYLKDIKEFSELGDSFEEPVVTYSSGMRSRLGFSAALMTRVDILMIDEVLAVGDAQFKRKAEQAIKSQIKGDKTVIFVSHAQGEVRKLCDRAVWLHDGRVAAEGASGEVVQQYQDFIKAGALKAGAAAANQ